MGQSSAIVSTVANPNLSWSLQPGVLIGVALVGGAYVMRWRRVRASTPRPGADAPVWRLCCFAGSLARGDDRADLPRWTRSPTSCSSCT